MKREGDFVAREPLVLVVRGLRYSAAFTLRNFRNHFRNDLGSITGNTALGAYTAYRIAARELTIALDLPKDKRKW